jgi:glycosyltransferase involved in cell wall biosynthesis
MRVSVLLPVFNGADALALAIRSVLVQTLKDFELIIVNDGSTDGTLDVARSFADPRIRVIDLETNGGLVNALNIGLAEAQGQFLARMDYDDICAPERLQRQVDAMSGTDAVICGSAIQPFGAIRGKAIVYPREDAQIRATLPVVSPFAHPAVMMRTEVCCRLGYLASALHCEDYDLWWRMAGEGVMMNLPDVMLHYRFHGSQISAIHRSSQLSGMAEVAIKNLRSTGRFRSVSDLQCHRCALSYEPANTLEELAAIGEWLRWLRESFDGADEVVASHYMRVWRGVCSRQRHLGRGIWAIYKRFKPIKKNLKTDLLVLLAAYGGIGQDDSKVMKLRKFFRR